MNKVRLGDIATVITKGTTPTSLGYDFVDSGINFIKIESITEDGSFIADKFAYITDECNQKLSRSQLQENDILFSIAGAIGRVAIVDGGILPANTNQALAIIRVPKGIYEYNFLKYILKSPMISKQFEKQKQGVAQINLSLKNISDFEIPVISLEQQKQISFVLDKITDLIDNRKKQLEKLYELVKARFVELFGDYRINEKGFDCKKGSELFKFSSGKFLPEEKRLDEGIPVYGGNGIAWHTNEYLIDYPTIIIGRVGAQCGNIHAVTTPVWITDNAIYIKEQKTRAYTLEFLTELMRMMDFYQYADFSGQPKITQKPLETLDYIMPPIELQNEYTSFVEQPDKAKLEIQKSLEKLELLKKALMQKYFG